MIEVDYVQNYWTELGWTNRENSTKFNLTRQDMALFRNREDMHGQNRYIKFIRGIIDKIDHGSDILIKEINFDSDDRRVFQDVFDTKIKFINANTYTIQDHTKDILTYNYRMIENNKVKVIDINDIKVLEPQSNLEKIVEETLPFVPEALQRDYEREYGAEADIYLNRDFNGTFRVY